MSDSPANGAQALDWNAAMAQLGVVPNPIGASWPELTERLLKLYAERVSQLPFVPTDWLANVRAVAATPAAPVAVTPYMVGGALKTTTGTNAMPAWIVGDPAAAAAWAQIAAAAHDAVAAYTNGQIEAGRKIIDDLNADAHFWATLYSAAVFIKKIPGAVIEGATSGAQSVLGDVLKSLFSSWLVWLLVLGGVGYAGWRLGWINLRKKGT